LFQAALKTPFRKPEEVFDIEVKETTQPPKTAKKKTSRQTTTTPKTTTTTEPGDVDGFDDDPEYVLPYFYLIFLSVTCFHKIFLDLYSMTTKIFLMILTVSLLLLEGTLLRLNKQLYCLHQN